MPLDGSTYEAFPEVVVLREAERIIRQFGWVQRNVGIDGGPRCVIGAILQATRQCYANSTRYSDVHWAAGYAYGTAVGASRIEAWQDAPERTLDDVLGGFPLAVDRAIELRLQKAMA